MTNVEELKGLLVIAGAMVAVLLVALGALLRWPNAMAIALILAIVVTVIRLRGERTP